MPRTTVIFFFWILALTHCHAEQVIGIQDGDTLTVLQEGKPLKIRLADIDAPEKSQAYGQKSKKSLSDLCYRKDALLDKRAIDKYGRTVARVYCAGIDANRAQVEHGMAWVYDKYNQDASLPPLQEKAKASHVGLWADKNPIPPWVFRHPTKPTESSESICHVGPNGGRYILINGHKRYGCVR